MYIDLGGAGIQGPHPNPTFGKPNYYMHTRKESKLEQQHRQWCKHNKISNKPAEQKEPLPHPPGQRMGLSPTVVNNQVDIVPYTYRPRAPTMLA